MNEGMSATFVQKKREKKKNQLTSKLNGCMLLLLKRYKSDELKSLCISFDCQIRMNKDKLFFARCLLHKLVIFEQINIYIYKIKKSIYIEIFTQNTKHSIVKIKYAETEDKNVPTGEK